VNTRTPPRNRADNLRQARCAISERPGITTRQLAKAISLTPQATLSLCVELSATKAVRSVTDPAKRRSSGYDTTRCHAIDARRIAASGGGYPFVPLRAPRATIVPVRTGGRMAPDVRSDAAVSMGRPSPNDHYKREGAPC
jgi:hypothetical protein